jgi:methylated-DNA-[protein]-cysteine S-methyltransferase
MTSERGSDRESENAVDSFSRNASGHAILDTAMGFMGLAWNEAGLTRLCLPEKTSLAIERRLHAHGPASVQAPAWVAALIAAIHTYTAGDRVEFAGVPVDLAGIDDFRLAIYAETRKLAYGETATYGELAGRAGHPGLARETGAALGANPVPLVIPCHRIIAAGGRIGGFSAPGGSTAKARMLAMEGVRVGPPPPAQASFGF